MDVPLLFHPPHPQARRDAPLPVGFSHVRATQAYLRSVEETEREKPRRARGSAAAVGIHEESGLVRHRLLDRFLFFDDSSGLVTRDFFIM